MGLGPFARMIANAGSLQRIFLVHSLHWPDIGIHVGSGEYVLVYIRTYT